MKRIHYHFHFRMPFRTFSKMLLLISGIMLLGFSSCRSRQAAKYGPPPTAYEKMEKPQ